MKSLRFFIVQICNFILWRLSMPSFHTIVFQIFICNEFFLFLLLYCWSFFFSVWYSHLLFFSLVKNIICLFREAFLLSTIRNMALRCQLLLVIFMKLTGNHDDTTTALQPMKVLTEVLQQCYGMPELRVILLNRQNNLKLLNHDIT